MKKIISFFIFLSMLFAPIFTFAVTFDHDLMFGMRQDAEVMRLQEFLRDTAVYSGPITGNFFSLTLAAVQAFQKREGISPAVGYVGSITRARINGLRTNSPSREGQIALLMQQIKNLQQQLQLLQQGAGTPPPAPVVPSATPTPTAMPVSLSVHASTSTPSPTTAPQAAVLNIDGAVSGQFPQSATSPLKLGDFSLTNVTMNQLNISQIVVQISEDLNSSLNRGRATYLVLRNGATTYDEQISRTLYTLNSTQPTAGLKNISQISLPYNQVLAPGTTKNLSLWIENLDYVIGGNLQVDYYSLSMSSSATIQGGFTFTLTK